MARRKPLGAEDSAEQDLLMGLVRLGDEAAQRAIAAAQILPSAVDRMWADAPGRPRRQMTLAEARRLAPLLGYRLDLEKADPAATGTGSPRKKAPPGPQVPRQRLRASGDK